MGVKFHPSDFRWLWTRINTFIVHERGRKKSVPLPPLLCFRALEKYFSSKKKTAPQIWLRSGNFIPNASGFRGEFPPLRFYIDQIDQLSPGASFFLYYYLPSNTHGKKPPDENLVLSLLSVPVSFPEIFFPDKPATPFCCSWLYQMNYCS